MRTAVVINSTGEKQQLSAVGLWTVMVKTKELTEDLQEKAIRPYLNVFKFQWLQNTRRSTLWKISEDVVGSQK